MSEFTPKLIHVGCMLTQNRGVVYLLLRQMEPFRYIWFLEEQPGIETETAIWGATPEEACSAVYQMWRFNDMRMLHCGFRYTLPERDEVGTNALFHQMVSSYSSMTGIYFDEEVGSNCIVQNASAEARLFRKHLQQTTPT